MTLCNSAALRKVRLPARSWPCRLPSVAVPSRMTCGGMTVVPVTARVTRPGGKWSWIFCAPAAALTLIAVNQPMPSLAWDGVVLAVWCRALLAGCAAAIGRCGTGLGEWKPGRGCCGWR
jgi:hypothetical protein